MSLAPQYLINGLLAGVIYAAYSTGYSLVLTTSRFMHVCHGGILSVAGLLCWYLAVNHGIPLLPAAILAILCGIAVGVLLEICIYRKLRKNNLPFLLTMIVSLGCMTVLQNVLAMVFGTNMKYFGVGAILRTIWIGKIAIPGWQAVGFVVTITLLILLALFLSKTRVGSEIQSVSANAEMARLIGINLDSIYVIAMVLASALVSWLGVIEVLMHGMNCYGGTPFMLVGMVIRAIGGSRNNKGMLIAGLVYGILENMALLVVSSRWASPLTFVIFVIFILVKKDSNEKLGGGL